MANATMAQMPKVNGATPVSMSKNALIMSAGAICQQKRINETHSRSMNHSQGRKRIISQMTRQAGKAGDFCSSGLKVVSAIIIFFHSPTLLVTRPNSPLGEGLPSGEGLGMRDHASTSSSPVCNNREKREVASA